MISKTKKNDIQKPTIKLKIKNKTTIYEGDVIECEITGKPEIKKWRINNNSYHTTFFNNKPVIFNPESTPLDDEYVNLTVYVENSKGKASDTKKICLKKIFFGDIHWHASEGDGFHPIDSMYQNAISDNYLDFTACTDHAFFDLYSRIPIIRNLINFFKPSKWKLIKEKVDQYYKKGYFTTILGYEWGGHNHKNGFNNSCHINFYFKDNYPNARQYSFLEKSDYDEILEAMYKDYKRGHHNIAFPHHPLARFKNSRSIIKRIYNYNIDWDLLVNNIKEKETGNKLIRGAEIHSSWGNSIGKYSGLPVTWPYDKENTRNFEGSWMENAFWKYSETNSRNLNFVMQAGSDAHTVDRPISTKEQGEISGITAVYTTHNTREKIWDAMNNCDMYASQFLKIRACIRFNEEFALGRWIQIKAPLKIRVSAMATFSGIDNNGKTMCPHGYNKDFLDTKISDIWIVKKDREKGRPWCKIIKHVKPDKKIYVLNFVDSDVRPNDFYYVAIKQKGEEIKKDQDGYIAYLGPIFIKEVEK